MLNATSCRRIISHAATASLVYQVQSDMAAEGITLHIDNLPGLYDVFPQLNPATSSDQVVLDTELYPASSVPVDMLSPALYLHSSGSTGHPKSITFTYGRLLQWMNSSASLGTISLSFVSFPSRRVRKFTVGALWRNGAPDLSWHGLPPSSDLPACDWSRGGCIPPAISCSARRRPPAECL